MPRSLLAVGLMLLLAQPAFTLTNSGDKIISLPGLAKMPTFDMFSGYLPVGKYKKLHYWLNKCDNCVADNLIVWFNGGPGCSSLEGYFSEHGPFKFNLNGELVENPYSWNKLGHIVYIEAPAGVGFSVAPDWAQLNDSTTAEDNLKALNIFFEKFPELTNADLYISGESYAGVYIPSLVSYILDASPSIAQRIKGLMIGNGLLNANGNDDSLVYFAYYHGLFGRKMWRDILRSCCVMRSESFPDECHFYRFKSESCIILLSQLSRFIFAGGLNMYNLYHDCAPPEITQQIRYIQEGLHKRILSAIKRKLHGKLKHHILKSFEGVLKLTPPCSNSSLLTNYLNRQDVQEAIHVDNMRWDLCSERVHAAYVKEYMDVTSFLRRILSQEMQARVLLYFGDLDMACNHLGGEWFADNIGIDITVPRRPWSIERGGWDQIAGFVKTYDKLTYATVKGAGHMVPTDQPQAAFIMIEKFINDMPL